MRNFQYLKQHKKTSKQGKWAVIENARKRVQIFGNSLSGMIMPLIGVIMAWGIVTAFFIPTGWTPVSSINEFVVGPTITYLIPALIGFMGGFNIYDKRGGFMGAFVTFGLIAGTIAYQQGAIFSNVNILGTNANGSPVRSLGPQFLGAMIMGPLSAVVLKNTEVLWEGKIKSGFEMLVNNFYFAFLAVGLALTSMFGMLFPIMGINWVFAEIINALTDAKALPVASVLVELSKPLFLNNAINHGIFTPLGIQQVSQSGKSILFLIEANPAPGMGMLLALLLFDKVRTNRSQAGVASIVHFFGGIHEISFPFILMKPLLVFATIGGSVVSVSIFQIFNAGAVAPASPGSIIALFTQSAHGAFDYSGLALGVVAGLATSFVIAFTLIKFVYNKQEGSDMQSALNKMATLKGDTPQISPATTDLQTAVNKAKKIVFACDAGMGSSAMGATLLRKKLKEHNITNVQVSHASLSAVPKDADIIITQKTLVERAQKQNPGVHIYAISQFLTTTEYAALLDALKMRKSL